MGSHARAQNPVHYRQISSPPSGSTQPLLCNAPLSSSSIDGPSKGSLNAKHRKESTKQYQRQVTIDIIPDDVLHNIFKFLLDHFYYTTRQLFWRTLVHVCQRWRYIVFASPRGLGLRFYYTGISPTKILDVWPAARIDIWGDFTFAHRKSNDTCHQCANNLLTVFCHTEYRNRVSALGLTNSESWVWKRLAPGLQKPFPELSILMLEGHAYQRAVLPDSFLGGSYPRLQRLSLINVSLPAMEKLLLSANHLVSLTLHGLCRPPDPGYISLQALATCLSVLTRLEHCDISFRYWYPRSGSRPEPASRHPPPLTYFTLPALTHLDLTGMGDDVDELVAHIDCPLLSFLTVNLFMDSILDVPQLHQFISRAEKLLARNHAYVVFSKSMAHLTNRSPAGPGLVDDAEHTNLDVSFACERSGQQLSFLAQLCSSPSPCLSSVEELDIIDKSSSLSDDDMDSVQWLKLLTPFTAVKKLYLHEEPVLRVMHALQGLGESVTRILPVLQTISIYESKTSRRPIEEATERFITARRLSGHPVAVLDIDI